MAELLVTKTFMEEPVARETWKMPVLGVTVTEFRMVVFQVPVPGVVVKMLP